MPVSFYLGSELNRFRKPLESQLSLRMAPGILSTWRNGEMMVDGDIIVGSKGGMANNG